MALHIPQANRYFDQRITVFSFAHEIVVHFWLTFGLLLAYFHMEGVTFDVVSPCLTFCSI